VLKGHIEAIEGVISGWAYDDAAPARAVSLELYVGGSRFATVSAATPRADLFVLNTGNISYGFSIPAPPGMRADEIVFGAAAGGYIVQLPTARQSHLANRLYHPVIIEAAAAQREMVYSGPTTAATETVLERICEAAIRANEAGSLNYGPIWGELVASRHGEVNRLLQERATPALDEHLRELGRRAIAFGFFDGPDAHLGAEQNPLFRTAGAKVIFDRILSLAEALACIEVENPEQGVWGKIAEADPSNLLDSIGKSIGLPNLAPPVGGFWGLGTTQAVVNARTIDALYIANRIVETLARFRLEGVTEIGGGAGLVAYYCANLGITPYKIVDLPTMNAVQAFTLRGVRKLRLFGESTKYPDVDLTPTWDFSLPSDTPYDLLVNIDSLPEIETTAALNYLRDARKHGYRYFLSINQESADQVGTWSQGRVNALASQVGGYRRLARHRYWMRPGYVEEIYAISPGQ
jgi:hypothetical protein